MNNKNLNDLSNDMIPDFESTTSNPTPSSPMPSNQTPSSPIPSNPTPSNPTPAPPQNPSPEPSNPTKQPAPDVFPDMFPESAPEISDPATPKPEINKYISLKRSNKFNSSEINEAYLTKKSAACLGILLVLSSAAIGFCSGMLGATYSSENSQSQTAQTYVSNNSNQNISDNSTENTPTATAPTSTSVQTTLPDVPLIQIAESTKNSVVEIVTETVKTDSLMHQYVSAGAGSGVIISEDGYIVTNNHVIANANKITVTLRNNEKYNATVKGRAPELDIALLKIEKSGLHPATLGDSAATNVGEEVIAVGNPLGQLGGTVTNGIISALNRDITINNETMNLLQTNAAINPGNSGGGLFNMKGELIGIVVAKTKASNTEGLGFAVPINDVKAIESDLRQYGYVKGKASLGMSLVNASSVKSSETGVLISKVPESSYASNAGFKYADKIISVNSKEIKNINDIDNIIKSCSPGDVIPIVIVRGSEKLTIDLTLSESSPS